jgi:hypothetical protein
MGRPRLDLLGRRFGRLTVLARAPTDIIGRKFTSFWRCKCICGNERVVRQSFLRSGEVDHCGCARRSPVKVLSGIGLCDSLPN